MQRWLPEAAFARRAGVSLHRLARLRQEEAAAGYWQRAFGAYLWNLTAMELVQKMAQRKKGGAARAVATASEPSAPEKVKVTLKALWRREDRLYRALSEAGEWLLVQTRRWYPLGALVRVEKAATGVWRESA